MEGLSSAQLTPRVPVLGLHARCAALTCLPLSCAAASCCAQEWEREAERDGRYFRQQAEGELTRAQQSGLVAMLAAHCGCSTLHTLAAADIACHCCRALAGRYHAGRHANKANTRQETLE